MERGYLGVGWLIALSVLSGAACGDDPAPDPVESSADGGREGADDEPSGEMDAGRRDDDDGADGRDSGMQPDGVADSGMSGARCSADDPSGCIDEVAGKARSDFGSYWKDSWFIMGCPMKDADGHDCRIIPECPNGDAQDFEDRGAVANETFPLGGELGTTYAVTFQFNAIAEGKYYHEGSYADPELDPATPGGAEPSVDEAGLNRASFYIGGKAVPTDYNVMRLRVLDASHNELARYYMNAFPQGSGAESHRTFLFSYQHTIDVPGQGFVEYRFQDANCKAVDNCGAGNVDDHGPCDTGRALPNEPNVTLPAMYTDVASSVQPHLVPLAELNPQSGAAQPWHAQLGHLTVTNIVPRPGG